MEITKNKSSRRIWTPEETKAFLDAYSNRQFEFRNTKLKKYAMANILEDLLALGVLSQLTTVEMLQIKLKNLLRAFKATSDGSKRTGESASKASFEEQMEEIFGTRPEIRNSHTINLTGRATDALPMSITTRDSNFLESQSSSSALLDPESPSPSCHTASSSGKKKMTCRERRLTVEMDLKHKTAADRNNILAEYAAKKIKKNGRGGKGEGSRLFKKGGII